MSRQQWGHGFHEGVKFAQGLAQRKVFEPQKREEWFAEKATQVSQCRINAFGISLYSRYGSAYELREMLACACGLAGEGIEQAVKEIFYDSQAGIASIRFDEQAMACENWDEIKARVESVVKEHISALEWDGCAWYPEEPEFLNTSDSGWGQTSLWKKFLSALGLAPSKKLSTGAEW